jgi:small subunit ribosomal protein S9
MAKTSKKNTKKDKKVEESKEISGKYYEAVGRRKTSIARVRLFPDADKGILINDKQIDEYFPTKRLRSHANAAFDATKTDGAHFVSVHIVGGGKHSQADAMRHGVARALLKIDTEFSAVLKAEGYLTRDSRMKERRKFGLKKARKAPQWAKR